MQQGVGGNLNQYLVLLFDCKTDDSVGVGSQSVFYRESISNQHHLPRPNRRIDAGIVGGFDHGIPDLHQLLAVVFLLVQVKKQSTSDV